VIVLGGKGGLGAVRGTFVPLVEGASGGGNNGLLMNTFLMSDAGGEGRRRCKGTCSRPVCRRTRRTTVKKLYKNYLIKINLYLCQTWKLLHRRCVYCVVVQ